MIAIESPILPFPFPNFSRKDETMVLPRDAIRNTSKEEGTTLDTRQQKQRQRESSSRILLDVHQLDNGTSDAWSAKRFTGL